MELIDRRALIDGFIASCNTGYESFPLDFIFEAIEQVPAIDAVPVVRKPVVGYEQLYEVDCYGEVHGVDRTVRVNDNGRVYDKPIRGRRMRQSLHTGGYKTVSLTKDGVTKTQFVHRIVAAAFLPNPENLPYINHKDEDRTNNRLDNLEWCNNSYNVLYNNASKRAAEKKRGVPHEKVHNRKISQSLFEYYETHESKSKGRKSEKRKPVDQFDLDGHFIRTFNSTYDPEIRPFRQNIQACCTGKRKTANGFIWKYNDYGEPEATLNAEKGNEHDG